MLIGCDRGLLVVDRRYDPARRQSTAVTYIYFNFRIQEKQSENGYWWTEAATSRYPKEGRGYHALTSPTCMHWRSAAIHQTKLLDLLKETH